MLMPNMTKTEASSLQKSETEREKHKERLQEMIKQCRFEPRIQLPGLHFESSQTREEG
jgi:predicted component of type VI protein secretion system